MINLSTLEIKPRYDFTAVEENTSLSGRACEDRFESTINSMLPTGYRIAYVKRSEMHDEHFYIYAVAKSFSHTMEVTGAVNRHTGEVDLCKYAPVPLFTTALEEAA
ncbi:MAG: hypothetical protein HC808_05830 [Candidatus Competibacteraceae bacterium]|nr:hypothetical protein [Candidatus Competibacteraceae bacterium]